jgi:hypothetical protein
MNAWFLPAVIDKCASVCCGRIGICATHINGRRRKIHRNVRRSQLSQLALWHRISRGGVFVAGISSSSSSSHPAVAAMTMLWKDIGTDYLPLLAGGRIGGSGSRAVAMWDYQVSLRVAACGCTVIVMGFDLGPLIILGVSSAVGGNVQLRRLVRYVLGCLHDTDGCSDVGGENTLYLYVSVQYSKGARDDEYKVGRQREILQQ